jgi:membrane protease YdiL (CAAX protease family)
METATARAGPPAIAPTYEGVWRRFLANVLDNAVWIVFLFWIASWIPGSTDPTLVGVVFLVLLTAWFNYFAFAEWRWGQTIGKNALGLRVTTELGERPGWNAAAIRNLFRLVDFLLIGPIMIAASSRRQRLGDRLAHTVVIREERAGERTAAARTPMVEASPPPGAPVAAPLASEPPPPKPIAGPPPPEPPTPAHAPEAEEGVGLPPASWRPVTVLAASVTVIVLSIIEVGVVAAFDPDLDSTAARLSAQALLAVTLIVVALGFASRPGHRLPFSSLGLRGFKLSAVGLALATFGGYVLFAAVYASIVQPEQEDLTRDLGFDEGGFAAIAAGVLIVAVAPVSEEVFFRGFMFAGLRRRMPLWPAAAVAAIVFGALHYTGPDSIGVVPQLVIFGMALAWLYEYTGSLWPPILVHVINNGIAFAIVTST